MTKCPFNNFKECFDSDCEAWDDADATCVLLRKNRFASLMSGFMATRDASEDE